MDETTGKRKADSKVIFCCPNCRNVEWKIGLNKDHKVDWIYCSGDGCGMRLDPKDITLSIERM